MKMKTKELVQELHEVPGERRKKTQSSSLLSPIALEKSRDHSSMSMRASTTKSRVKQRHSTFNAAVRTVQQEYSQKLVPRKPYHQSSKSLVLPPRRTPRVIKGCENPFAALFPEGCLTCGKQHIEVKYFKQRHVCLKCREYLKTSDGRQASVYLLPNGKILAVSKKVSPSDPSQIMFQEVDHNSLKLFDRQAYATFASQDEMIILLKHPDE